MDWEQYLVDLERFTFGVFCTVAVIFVALWVYCWWQSRGSR